MLGELNAAPREGRDKNFPEKLELGARHKVVPYFCIILFAQRSTIYFYTNSLTNGLIGYWWCCSIYSRNMIALGQ